MDFSPAALTYFGLRRAVATGVVRQADRAPVVDLQRRSIQDLLTRRRIPVLPQAGSRDPVHHPVRRAPCLLTRCQHLVGPLRRIDRRPQITPHDPRHHDHRHHLPGRHRELPARMQCGRRQRRVTDPAPILLGHEIRQGAGRIGHARSVVLACVTPLQAAGWSGRKVIATSPIISPISKAVLPASSVRPVTTLPSSKVAE
jgi:hypothetical protein